MEEPDCFKCSLCVFLLEENEKLKAQLLETSIGFSNYNKVLLVDNDTQTDPISIHSVDIDSTSVDLLNGPCQAILDIANDMLGEGQTVENEIGLQSVQLADQTNHEIRNVKSIDMSCQISVESSNGSSRQELAIPKCPLNSKVPCSKSFAFDQSINTPYQSIPGKPFADFSASELVKDFVFDRINGREVKYFGDSRYSYGNSWVMKVFLPYCLNMITVKKTSKILSLNLMKCSLLT